MSNIIMENYKSHQIETDEHGSIWHILKNTPNFWRMNREDRTREHELLCVAYVEGWSTLLCNSKLPEFFMEKYYNKLLPYNETACHFSWHFFAEYQHLSEEFIEKHIDKIGWFDVLKWQSVQYDRPLREQFILKHIENIKRDDNDYYGTLLRRNHNLSEFFYKKWELGI